MALENKLGITDSAVLAREEERISKKKAVWLFESGTLDALPVGTFAALQERSARSIWQRETSALHLCCIWKRYWTASTGCPSPPLTRLSRSMWR